MVVWKLWPVSFGTRAVTCGSNTPLKKPSVPRLGFLRAVSASVDLMLMLIVVSLAAQNSTPSMAPSSRSS